MKKIIIPTDFSLQSLSIIHNIIKQNAAAPVSITALHMLQMPSDILDLMFLNKFRTHEQVPAAFNEAVQALRNKYGRQLQLTVDIIYGSNTRVLKNYFEKHVSAQLFMLEDFCYSHGLKNSVNLKPMLVKCRPDVQLVYSEVKTNVQQPNLLSALLVSDTLFSLEPQPALEASI